MNEWFECSVRYEKTLENGMQKYVSEPYLVEAISFTEAEQRFIEEIQPFMSGEYEVKAVSKRKISELFEDDKELADKWFKCKVAFVTLDERSGIEKRTAGFHLIPSSISHWGASTLPPKLMIHIIHRKRRDAVNRIGAVEHSKLSS